MVLLGIISKREVVRARMRARTSMTVQARDQGSYLGGRLPYGYRLVDAGPHPNRAWARCGARAQRLDIDPTNGPVVTWMFQQRLAGHSMARNTRALNDMKIPCPAAADRERNPHRTAEAWTLTSVHAVLSNPRYTGRQVWNRQRTDHELIDPDNTTLGHRDVMRRNTPDEWIISEKQAHPALVSEADFVAAQAIRAEKKAVGRTYQLAGLLRCGHCSRLMESCWSNGRAAYRYRHGHSSATPRNPHRTPKAYLREDQVLAHLPALHLMRTGEEAAPGRASALARLRADGIGLIYDQTSRTVTANTERKERIVIGR